MIYYCENCGFLFSRTGDIKECPSCEKKQIRSATGEETQRLMEYIKHSECGVK